MWMQLKDGFCPMLVCVLFLSTIHYCVVKSICQQLWYLPQHHNFSWQEHIDGRYWICWFDAVWWICYVCQSFVAVMGKCEVITDLSNIKSRWYEASDFSGFTKGLGQRNPANWRRFSGTSLQSSPEQCIGIPSDCLSFLHHVTHKVQSARLLTAKWWEDGWGFPKP